ncbi:polysaccharide deacetylase family protein [Pseudonocardia nigra]|uniref:polysaccharide deacetylase family protein n=1 Tax=Pseudonocardia nigra TaxID=1921578 RepID=UPI001C5E6F7F|nr:polysaccharide deacetylase family protein [Pseudonocardia nigra]
MPILCYHSVACGWEDPVSVEPVDFERQCRTLQRRGGTVPLSAVRDRLAADGTVPVGATVLTFDDGFADYAEHAVPIMQRYGLTATMYVVAGSVTPNGVAVGWITGLDPADAPPLLTADQIRDLHDRGWEIGSHSMAHRDLPTLSEAECLADLRESREILSDLIGHPVTTLAYPFGRHAPHVRRAAHKAGYACAMALPEGPEPGGPFAVPRTGIYRGNPMWKFAAKTSRWYPAVRTSSVYQRAAAAVRGLRARSAA